MHAEFKLWSFHFRMKVEPKHRRHTKCFKEKDELQAHVNVLSSKKKTSKAQKRLPHN